MKLRTKLMLIATLGVVAAVCITTLIIITFTRGSVINSIVLMGTEDIARDVSTVIREADIKSTSESTYLNYLADSLSPEYAVYLGNEIITNDTGIDPVVALETYGEQYENSYTLCANFSVGAEYYFVTRESIIVNANEYSIYLVRNTTDRMQEVNQLTIVCLITGLCVVLVTGLFVYLFTRRAVAPIKKLETGAEAVSRGKYDTRIDIKGKDEIAGLAHSFNIMAQSVLNKIDELNENARRKQDFINGFTHELKTPVTSIMARAQTLLVRDISPEDRARTLEGIYRQCVWMEDLSSKLTSLILLQKPIEKSECSVVRLMEEVRDNVQSDINLEIHCSIKTLNMDSSLIRSALINLVSNSTKAGAKTVTITAKDNKICVVDDGCGIEHGKIDKLTQPFYTADESRSKKNGGLGLGLSIVNSIVRAHGWDLEIKSEIGEGTEVIITF